MGGVATTNVYYQHNVVTSTIVATEEGIFQAGQVPGDISSDPQITIQVVHEVQLTDRAGNLIVFHFDVPKAKDSNRNVIDYAAGNKTRTFSSTTDNQMPTGLFTAVIKKRGEDTRSIMQFPKASE